MDCTHELVLTSTPYTAFSLRVVMIGDGATDMEACPPAVSSYIHTVPSPINAQTSPQHGVCVCFLCLSAMLRTHS